jgi:outer membrane protein assembly factor BamB
LITLAYEEKTGREVWRRGIRPKAFTEIYKANDPAAPTPATDGRNLYVYFGDFGLISYTRDGKERWRHEMPAANNFYGMGTSPVVVNGMVLLLCDQSRGSFALALDAATGKVKWRKERPESTEGWSVPVVWKDELILAGSTRVDGYYLATGEPKWWMELNSNGAIGAPVIVGETLVVTATGSDAPWIPTFASTLAKVDKDGDGKISRAEGKDEKDWFEHFNWVDSNGDGLLDQTEWNRARDFGVGGYGAVAIPLGGKGRLDPGVVKWRVKRNLPYIPSALLYGGVFYLIKSGGIITSLDPATGVILKQGRSTGALGEYYSSPVAGDGKIYAVSEEGKLTVLKAGAQWEVLGVHALGEEVYATPAIADGRLLVRTRGSLYSFGGK